MTTTCRCVAQGREALRGQVRVSEMYSREGTGASAKSTGLLLQVQAAVRSSQRNPQLEPLQWHDMQAKSCAHAGTMPLSSQQVHLMMGRVMMKRTCRCNAQGRVPNGQVSTLVTL
jgi:hypothetical protein